MPEFGMWDKEKSYSWYSKGPENDQTR